VITASMFWILAMLEQRRGRIRLTNEERGLAAQYPKLAVLMVFFTLAGAGLPGLNSFVGELLAMTGMMRVSGTIVAIAVLGTVLGAWYGLRIVQRLLFGGGGHSGHAIHHHHPGRDDDLSFLEWCPLTAVAIICFLIGVVPQASMALFKADTDRLARIAEPVSKRVHTDIDTLSARPAFDANRDVVAIRSSKSTHP
jgi:NADH-quinone oxidoreductase subunit M